MKAHKAQRSEAGCLLQTVHQLHTLGDGKNLPAAEQCTRSAAAQLPESLSAVYAAFVVTKECTKLTHDSLLKHSSISTPNPFFHISKTPLGFNGRFPFAAQKLEQPQRFSASVTLRAVSAQKQAANHCHVPAALMRSHEPSMRLDQCCSLMLAEPCCSRSKDLQMRSFGLGFRHSKNSSCNSSFKGRNTRRRTAEHGRAEI